MPAETHSDHDRPARPPSGGRTIERDEIADLIRRELAEVLEVDIEVVALTDRFADDLGADSLALIELVERLEEQMGRYRPGFRIDDDNLAELRTVGEAVDHVVALLG